MGFLGKIGSAMTLGALDEDEVESFIPGIGDAQAQDKANKTNIRLAAENRDWQERMSNSAYQRAMDDMKKAGLNPMLAYMQGGASTPSTAAASVNSSSKTGLFDAALKAYTGISAAKSQATAVEQQQAMNQSSIQLQTATADKTRAETARTLLETKIREKEAPGAALKGKFMEKVSRAGNDILDGMDKFKSSAQETMKSKGFNKFNSDLQDAVKAMRERQKN